MTDEPFGLFKRRSELRDLEAEVERFAAAGQPVPARLHFQLEAKRIALAALEKLLALAQAGEIARTILYETESRSVRWIWNEIVQPRLRSVAKTTIDSAPDPETPEPPVVQAESEESDSAISQESVQPKISKASRSRSALLKRDDGERIWTHQTSKESRKTLNAIARSKAMTQLGGPREQSGFFERGRAADSDRNEFLFTTQRRGYPNETNPSVRYARLPPQAPGADGGDRAGHALWSLRPAFRRASAARFRLARPVGGWSRRRRQQCRSAPDRALYVQPGGRRASRQRTPLAAPRTRASRSCAAARSCALLTTERRAVPEGGGPAMRGLPRVSHGASASVRWPGSASAAAL